MKKIRLVFTLIGLGLIYSLFYFIPKLYPSIGTKYSNDFNMTIYEKINIGEEREKVDLLLGQPIYKSIDNVNPDSLKVNYWYTESSSVLLMYEKIIIQFYDDKVINKIRILDGD